MLVAGNGGSHADALHFCEELTGRFRKDRRPLAAIALGEATHMSCVSNDYGFKHVFARQIEALAKPEDVVILLSTSGNSENITLAAYAALGAGANVVSLLGKGGGSIRALFPMIDMLIFPGETSDRIQELHMLCLHIVVEEVERKLFPNNYLTTI